ncbi:alpha/beta fold hydrolase, partial [Candidatus Micrarchaeota archaeon]|nr:alpha/beta fold hydrolase [Candidatus Micrarchaeota archaeon]
MGARRKKHGEASRKLFSSFSKKHVKIGAGHYISVFDQPALGVEKPRSTVVLIHGLASFKEIFAHQLKELPKAGYRVIALDLTSHGESTALSTRSIKEHAQDVHQVLQKLSVKDIIVGGHSMGTQVGLKFIEDRVLSEQKLPAEQRKYNLHGAMLFSGWVTPFADKRLEAYAQLISGQKFVSSLFGGRKVKFPLSALRFLGFTAAAKNNEVVNSVQKFGASSVQQVGQLGVEQFKTDNTQALAKLASHYPILLLHGDNDNIVPTKNSYEMIK